MSSEALIGSYPEICKIIGHMYIYLLRTSNNFETNRGEIIKEIENKIVRESEFTPEIIDIFQGALEILQCKDV